MQKTTDTILKVLNILDFKGDKQAIADKLLELCYHQALFGLINGLSIDKQEKIKKELGKAKSKEDFIKLAHNYFSEKQFLEAVEKATSSVFIKYMEEISPLLSEKQLEKLKLYLDSNME